MNGALEIAAIGLRTQQRALDAIADNVSNVNTPAFKGSELRFSELVNPPASVADETRRSRAEPGFGVALTLNPLIDTQGRLQATGKQLDLAIDGAGFIELMGPAGQTLLWRGGSLRILDDGILATASGIPLKANITVPRDATALRIDRTGKVIATIGDSARDIEIGTIGLVKVDDPASLDRLMGGIYAAGPEALSADGSAGEDGLGYLVQASLELSNVDLNKEMVNLIITQRAYAASAQMLKAADEFYSIANNLRSA